MDLAVPELGLHLYLGEPSNGSESAEEKWPAQGPLKGCNWVGSSCRHSLPFSSFPKQDLQF